MYIANCKIANARKSEPWHLSQDPHVWLWQEHEGVLQGGGEYGSKHYDKVRLQQMEKRKLVKSYQQGWHLARQVGNALTGGAKSSESGGKTDGTSLIAIARQ